MQKFEIKNLRYLSISFIILVSIVLAVISANRSDSYNARNDTFAYKSHFICLSENNDISGCKEYISSSKTEIAYDYLLALSSYTLGSDGFWYFKFYFSLLLSLVLLFNVFRLSGCSLVAMFILLMDYRFYGLFTNTLRHGLALMFATTAIVLYLSNSHWKSKFFRLLAFGSHTTSVCFFFLNDRKLKFSTWTIVFTVFIFFSITFSLIIERYSDVVGLYLPKILAYQERQQKSGTLNFVLPLNYLVIYFLATYCYLKRECKVVNVVYNLTTVVFLFGVIFYPLGMMGRFISFLPPLMAILVVRCTNVLFKNQKVNALVLLAFSVFALLMFFRKLDEILVYFNLEGVVI